MLPKGLISYPRNQLEREARDLFRRRPDIPFAPWIRVERLLQMLPNVIIEYSDNLRSDHHVEGCVCKQYMSRTLTVFIDSSMLSKPWHQYLAVVGEEFSHIHLHRACFELVHSIEDFVELQHDDEWHRFERDAKWFSAAVRMPAELVISEAEEAYPRLVEEYGFGDAMKVEKLLRNELASRFRTSPEDMQRRLFEWPLYLRNRILNSIQSANPTLVPDSWSVTAQPPAVQQPLFQRKPN